MIHASNLLDDGMLRPFLGDKLFICFRKLTILPILMQSMCSKKNLEGARNMSFQIK